MGFGMNWGWTCGFLWGDKDLRLKKKVENVQDQSQLQAGPKMIPTGYEDVSIPYSDWISFYYSNPQKDGTVIYHHVNMILRFYR